MTEAIKPCPFCGGEARKGRIGLDERWGYADQVTIACDPCGVRIVRVGDSNKGGYADNSKVEQQAIDAWNRRTK